jgi:hypothetical protein
MATAKVMNKNFVQVSTNYEIDNLTDILMTNECETNSFDCGQDSVSNDLIQVANCLLTLVIDGRMLIAFDNSSFKTDQFSMIKTGVTSGTNGVGIHANILIDKLIDNLKSSVKQQQNDGWASGQLMSIPMTHIKHTASFYNSHHVCSFKNFVQV